ncbi:MAG: S-layer homology domain-containing protein, partial [Clostridia bacterium]|nr:S-layer homology domain-containing protein [Clostridia bacterium]
VGTAKVIITGDGWIHGGLFNGTHTVEYNIHNQDISDWQLILNPAKVTFDPSIFYNATPKYTVYSPDWILDGQISGKFTHVSGDSMWAAGVNRYAFTTDAYGYEGTTYADFVIEPCPTDKLKIVFQYGDTWKYTGRPIQPNIKVSYVNSVGRTYGVESVHEHGSKTYTNYTVTYSNNVEPGVATATIVFEGNYTGTVTMDFTIYKETDASHTTHTGGKATCTSPAICTVCGEKYGGTASHKAGPWQTVKVPTLTETGLNERHCTTCNMVMDSEETRCFADVPADSWYAGAVEYVAVNGLMNGVSGTRFSPSGTTTRAMVVTVLYRMEGSPAIDVDTPFTDLKDAWYMDAVAWAYDSKVVNGMNPTTFAPNGEVTREQLATILYRYSEYKGYDISATADISVFPDCAKVSSWANEALIWANAEGLINGTNVGGQAVLDPQGKATRAQVATILMRFRENIE